MSYYRYPNPPNYVIAAKDFFIDDWSGILTLSMPSDSSKYPVTVGDPVLYNGALSTSHAELVAGGWGGLPYSDDHRAFMLYNMRSYQGRSAVVWSRKPAAEDLGLDEMLADPRLWEPMPSIPDPTGELPVMAGLVVRQWLFARYITSAYPTALLHHKEYASYLWGGSTWYASRWEVELDEVVIASVAATEQYDFTDPPVWIEVEDRPPMTGVGLVDIVSDDLKKLADVIERLMSQKITLSLNNGRIVIQFPTGETVEEARS